jgi:Tfp pilus assembly protein PilF
MSSYVLTLPLRRGTLALLISAAAVLPYLNSLGNELTFDDLFVVRNNPAVRDGSLHDVVTWVYDPGGYRPLTMLTYAANARLGGDVPGFHGVNVGLHALTSVAVFFLARRLLGSVAATAAALLFAVHPIHTEAVTSIVGRAELLACLLAVGSLLAFLHAEQAGTGSRFWRGASLLLFAGAVLAKESAFTAIPLIAVVHAWTADRLQPRRLAALLLPYAAVAGAYLGLRLLVVGALGIPTRPDFLDNPLAHATAGVRLRTATIILWDYLSLLVLPWQLSADYSFDQVALATSPLDWRFLTAFGVLAALAAGLLAAARRAPELLLATCFTFVPLALTANVLFPIGTIKAERLLYMPSIGICLAAGWLVARSGKQHWFAATAALGIVIAVFGARTWVRNRDWRDSLTLFTATVAASPRSAKAHHNLAVALHMAGRTEEALRRYRESFRIFPWAGAACAVGREYEALGASDEALSWYEHGVGLDWSHVPCHVDAGGLHYRQGRLTSAEAALRTAVQQDPGSAQARVNLAILSLAEGHRIEALVALENVAPRVIDNPTLLDAWNEARRALAEVEKQ